jgi:hypothetical protein
MKEILVALSPILVAVLTAIIGPSILEWVKSKFAKNKENKVKKEEKDSGLMFSLTLNKFNILKDTIEELFAKTKVDRFLILVAKNGKEDFKFATAIYEQHADNDKVKLSFGAVGKYVDFQFDDNYRQILKEAEIKGLYRFDVDKEPDSDLKNIYISEGVNYSTIYFLKRIKNYDGEDNDCILYSSFATHDTEAFSPNDHINKKLVVNKIKADVIDEIEF